MKKRGRGRRTILNRALARALCKIIATPCTIRSACVSCGVSESAVYEWIRRGEAGERPFAQFVQALTRARGCGKVKIQRDIWASDNPRVKLELLARLYPNEFADRRPLPVPLEEPASVGIKMFATLPSGNIASVDEMLAVSRLWHEKWNQARIEQHEPEPKNDDEPMDSWYNPATHRVEPIDHGDDEN
jgi:hypothetical protein